MQVKVEAYHDGESWCARGIGEDFFTQGDSLDELMDNITLRRPPACILKSDCNRGKP